MISVLRSSSSSVTTTSTVTTLLDTTTLSSIHHLLITTTKQARNAPPTSTSERAEPTRECCTRVRLGCAVREGKTSLACSWPIPVLCPCDSSGNNFIEYSNVSSTVFDLSAPFFSNQCQNTFFFFFTLKTIFLFFFNSSTNVLSRSLSFSHTLLGNFSFFFLFHIHQNCTIRARRFSLSQVGIR